MNILQQCETKKNWSLLANPFRNVGSTALHKNVCCAFNRIIRAIYRELLQVNDTINSEKYYTQLNNFKTAIPENALF